MVSTCLQKADVQTKTLHVILIPKRLKKFNKYNLTWYQRTFTFTTKYFQLFGCLITLSNIEMLVQLYKLTNNFKWEGLVELGNCRNLTFKPTCIARAHIFQLQSPAAMPWWNQLVSVIVYKTVTPDEKHVWIQVSNPRHLKFKKKNYISFDT